jgi:hypothetical protein
VIKNEKYGVKKVRLKGFWRHMVRSFLKPVSEHGVCRIGTNQELTEKHDTPDLVAITNVKRLKGLGNVTRGGQTEVPDIIFGRKPEGGKSGNT